MFYFSGNGIKLCKCILVEKSMKAMGCMKTSLEQEKYRMRRIDIDVVSVTVVWNCSENLLFFFSFFFSFLSAGQ